MAKQSKRGALARYLRSYHFAPRYRREHQRWVTTSDGVRLSVQVIDGPADAVATVVITHGFIHWSRTPPIHGFASRLAERFDVVVPDLRGHGRSGGRNTMGRVEVDDLETVIVACATRDRPVVTLGISLGGGISLMHASRYDSVAGVVAVSPPAYWGGLPTEGAARIERWIAGDARRRVLSTLLRTRIDPADHEPPSAAAIAAAIPADCFVLLASDPDDWYFAPDHAQSIHDALAPGVDRELWWLPRAGHGSDLLTPAFADRVIAAITARV